MDGLPAAGSKVLAPFAPVFRRRTDGTLSVC